MTEEGAIQQQILKGLSDHGMAIKIEMSGRPVRDKKGNQRLIPFNNKFYRTGISDIMFISQGSVFFLEVKTPEAGEKIWKAREQGLKYFNPETCPKSWRVVAKQFQFLYEASLNRAHCAFVSTVRMAMEFVFSPTSFCPGQVGLPCFLTDEVIPYEQI